MEEVNKVEQVPDDTAASSSAAVPPASRLILFGNESLQEDFEKIVEYTNVNKGWALIASPPRLGTTTRAKIALQSATLRSREANKVDSADQDLFGGFQLSSEWNNALAKYDITGQRSAERSSQITHGAAVERCKVVYLDLRGLTEYTEILTTLASQLALPLSDTTTLLEENLLYNLSKELDCTLIVLDHVNKFAIDVVVEMFSFIADRIGLLVIADLVVRCFDKQSVKSIRVAPAGFGGNDFVDNETVIGDRFVSEVYHFSAKLSLEWTEAVDADHDRILLFSGLLSNRESRALAAGILANGDSSLMAKLLKTGGVGNNVEGASDDEGSEMSDLMSADMHRMVELVVLLSEGVPGLVTLLCKFALSTLQQLAKMTGKEKARTFKLFKSKYVSAGRAFLGVADLIGAILSPECHCIDDQDQAILQQLVLMLNYMESSPRRQDVSAGNTPATSPSKQVHIGYGDVIFQPTYVWNPQTQSVLQVEEMQRLVACGLVHKTHDAATFFLPALVLENLQASFNLAPPELLEVHSLYFIERPCLPVIELGKTLATINLAESIPELGQLDLIRNRLNKLQRKMLRFGAHFHRLVYFLLEKLSMSTISVLPNGSRKDSVDRHVLLSTSTSLLIYAAHVLRKILPHDVRWRLALITGQMLSSISDEELDHILRTHVQKYGNVGEATEQAQRSHLYLALTESLHDIVKEVLWSKGMLKGREKTVLETVDMSAIFALIDRCRSLSMSTAQHNSLTKVTSLFHTWNKSKSLLLTASLQSFQLLYRPPQNLEDFSLEDYAHSLEELEIQCRLLKSEVPTHELEHWKLLGDKLKAYWKDPNFVSNKNMSILPNDVKETLFSLQVANAVGDLHLHAGMTLLWLLTRHEHSTSDREDLLMLHSGRIVLMLQQYLDFAQQPYDRLRIFQYAAAMVQEVPLKRHEEDVADEEDEDDEEGAVEDKAEEGVDTKGKNKKEKKVFLPMRDVEDCLPVHESFFSKAKESLEKAYQENHRIFGDKSLVTNRQAMNVATVWLLVHRINVMRHHMAVYNTADVSFDVEKAQLQLQLASNRDDEEDNHGEKKDASGDESSEEDDEELEDDDDDDDEDEEGGGDVNPLAKDLEALDASSMASLQLLVDKRQFFLSIFASYRKLMSVAESQDWKYRSLLAFAYILQGEYLGLTTMASDGRTEGLLTTAQELFRTAYKLMYALPKNDFHHMSAWLSCLHSMTLSAYLKPVEDLHSIVNVCLQGCHEERMISQHIVTQYRQIYLDGVVLVPAEQQEVQHSTRTVHWIHCLYRFAAKIYDQASMFQYAIPIYKELLFRLRDLNQLLHGATKATELEDWQHMMDRVETFCHERVVIQFAHVLRALAESLSQDASKRSGQISAALPPGRSYSIYAGGGFGRGRFHASSGPDVLCKQAIRALLRAGTIYEYEIQNSKRSAQLIMNVYQQLAHIHVQEEEYDDAKICYENIMRLFMEVPFIQRADIANTQMEYGQILMDSKEGFEASLLFQQAHEHYQLLLQHQLRSRSVVDKLPNTTDGSRLKRKWKLLCKKYQRQLAASMFLKATALFQEEDFEEAQSSAQFACRLYSDVFAGYVAEEDLKPSESSAVPAEDEIDDGPIIYRTEVAACYSLLAAIHHHFEELEDAQYFYNRAYEVYRNINMHESIEMAKVCHNLGAISDDMEKLEEAKDWYEKSLVILLRRHSKNYPQIMTTLESLHGLLEEMGLKDEADSVQQLSQEMEQRIHRAQEDSKELQDTLQRQLKGAALAELERQQLAASAAVTTHNTSVPWLSSRSSSYSSSSVKRKVSSNSSDSDKGSRLHNNNPLRQVVVINEHSNDVQDGGIDLHRPSSDVDLRGKSYDLNAVLNDEVLFSESVDEESLYQLHGNVGDIATPPPLSPMNKAGSWYSDSTPKHLGSWSFDHEADSIENGGIKRQSSGSNRFQVHYGKSPRGGGTGFVRADSKGARTPRGKASSRGADKEEEHVLPSGNTCIIA